MLLDIIIIAIVLLLTLIGLKRGIAKTLYGIICLAVAVILAYMAAKLLSEYVYNSFILKSVTESVRASFESSAVTSSKVSKGIFDSLPGVLAGLLNGVGITQKGFASSMDSMSATTQRATLAVVDKVISPVIISFLSVVFFILLFIIIMLFFKLLIGRRILKLFKLPIIRWINALLGGVFGLCEGILLVFLFIAIIKIVSVFSASPIISQDMINSSYLFKAVYYWDLTALVSNITG
ncbi:MAG: CvpA family protein [Ruminococcus sp.]|nr:CvpA family protein [Ruminococcus sp.]